MKRPTTAANIKRQKSEIEQARIDAKTARDRANAEPVENYQPLFKALTKLVPIEKRY